VRPGDRETRRFGRVTCGRGGNLSNDRHTYRLLLEITWKSYTFIRCRRGRRLLVCDGFLITSCRVFSDVCKRRFACTDRMFFGNDTIIARRTTQTGGPPPGIWRYSLWSCSTFSNSRYWFKTTYSVRDLVFCLNGT